MTMRQKLFSHLYKRAGVDSELAWHRDEPPRLLSTVIEQRPSTGRALDLGCGQGVFSAYLASKGYSVVGVDFVASALDRAQSRVRALGATAEFVQSDVLDFSTQHRFDVVVDSACLHHIPSGKFARYAERLKQWLLPGGDYVLAHFKKQHALDLRPFSGNRKTKAQIVRLFPWLELQADDEFVFDVPFYMWGMSTFGEYWFKRTQNA